MYALILYCLLVLGQLAEAEVRPNHYELVTDGNPQQVFWEVGTPNGTEELWPVPIRKLPSCSRLFVGKLIYASTPKSNSRQMKKILCEILLRKKGKKITKQVEDALTSGRHWCLDTASPARRGLLRGWDNPQNTKIFVWRDPVDRFVSMYGHVCDNRQKRCGAAGESIHVAAKAFYEYLQFGRAPEGAKTPEFFVHHISPTSWSCGIGATPTKIHPVVYNKDPETLIKRLRKPLGKTEAPRQWVEAALNRLRTTTTNKLRLEPDGPMKYDNWISEVKSNRTTMAYVLATYYHDYRLWKMPIPSIDGI
ncbi:unnamed protein product, partial [Mesorhabditis spiculigera]